MLRLCLLLATGLVLASCAILQPRPRAAYATGLGLRQWRARVNSSESVRAGGFTNSTVEQRLDHFSATNKRTWKQRYFSSEKFYADGAAPGPIVVLLGGQEPVSEYDLENSHAFQIAKDLKGQAFLLEHRFYGESIPTADMSVDNLRYLKLAQAEADIVTFLKSIGCPDDRKVVLYGGLYAGTLAVWARLKYPMFVHAAVASSAPLLGQIAFPEFTAESMRVFEKYSPAGCRQEVDNVINYVDEQLKTDAGVELVMGTFSLCPPFGARPWDADMLFERMTIPVVDTLAHQSPAMDLVAMVCQMLQSPEDIRMKAKGLADAGGFGMNDEGCEVIDYEKSIEKARLVRWGEALDNRDEQVYDRPVLYQACYELGQFQTLTSEWKNRYPLEMYMQKCKDVFGGAFDRSVLESAVARRNGEFAVRKATIRRVVFVHGEDDAYAPITVLQPVHETAPVITIPGAQHCKDLPAPSRADSAHVTEARTQITKYLTSFLNAPAA